MKFAKNILRFSLKDTRPQCRCIVEPSALQGISSSNSTISQPSSLPKVEKPSALQLYPYPYELIALANSQNRRITVLFRMLVTMDLFANQVLDLDAEEYLKRERYPYRGKFPIVDARFWILMFEYTETPEGMDLRKSLNKASISVEDLGNALSKLCRYIHDFKLHNSEWGMVKSSSSDVVELLEEMELSNSQFQSLQIVLSSGYFGFSKISF